MREGSAARLEGPTWSFSPASPVWDRGGEEKEKEEAAQHFYLLRRKSEREKVLRENVGIFSRETRSATSRLRKKKHCLVCTGGNYLYFCLAHTWVLLTLLMASTLLRRKKKGLSEADFLHERKDGGEANTFTQGGRA